MHFAGNGCYYRNGDKMEYWYSCKAHREGELPDGWFDCDKHHSFHNCHIENEIRKTLECHALALILGQ